MLRAPIGLGLQIPNFNFPGVSEADLFERLSDVASTAESSGFDTVLVMDHLHQIRGVGPPENWMLDGNTILPALAARTSSVNLSLLVGAVTYRNPALHAKITTTLDVISGGRAELGLGAGWKEDEFTAYGFGFPPLRERMALLEDSLEIVTRMLGGGRATYQGSQASVQDAINVPRGLQSPRIPILVGGNGPNRTWRLAARYADELNLDWFSPEEIVESRPVIASRCEEIGRDPATLRLSVNIGRPMSEPEGPPRVDLLRRYREAGVDRVMTLVVASASDPAALARFADDCRAAGCELDG